MRELDRVLACWRSVDARFERARTTGWGAVVTDRRFSRIHDVNYARIDRPRRDLRLADVEAELHPDLVRAGAAKAHIVVFEPERATRLLAEASSAGAALSWEAVMTGPGARTPSRRPDVPVTEVRTFGPTFWRAFRTSAREFGAIEPGVAVQAEAIERQILRPAGRRWFTVRDGGRAVSFGSVIVLGDTALIDHVVTLPPARRRGYADAIVRRLCDEARAAGATMSWLLTDPAGHAKRVYERIGFPEVAMIASTIRPLDATLRTRPGTPSRAGIRGSRTTAT